jgi:hypothetical protein
MDFIWQFEWCCTRWYCHIELKRCCFPQPLCLLDICNSFTTKRGVEAATKIQQCKICTNYSTVTSYRAILICMMGHTIDLRREAKQIYRWLLEWSNIFSQFGLETIDNGQSNWEDLVLRDAIQSRHSLKSVQKTKIFFKYKLFYAYQRRLRQCTFQIKPWTQPTDKLSNGILLSNATRIRDRRIEFLHTPWQPYLTKEILLNFILNL